MKCFKVTQEHIAKAKVYMPLSMKDNLADSIAEKCVQPLDTALQNTGANELLPVPQLKGEDLVLKQILLLNTLLGFYLDVDVNSDKRDAYAMTDYYNGGDLIGQIEKFKGNPEVKDKAFAILHDYKEFRRIVDSKVDNRVMNENDSMGRFLASIQVFMTPDALNKIFTALKTEGEKYEQLRANRKAEAEVKQGTVTQHRTRSETEKLNARGKLTRHQLAALLQKKAQGQGQEGADKAENTVETAEIDTDGAI